MTERNISFLERKERELYVCGESASNLSVLASILASSHVLPFMEGLLFTLILLLFTVTPFKTLVYLGTKCLSLFCLVQLIQPDILKPALLITRKKQSILVYLENPNSFEMMNLLKFVFLIPRPSYTLLLKG